MVWRIEKLLVGCHVALRNTHYPWGATAVAECFFVHITDNELPSTHLYASVSIQTSKGFDDRNFWVETRDFQASMTSCFHCDRMCGVVKGLCVSLLLA